jgi:16S rRNA G966 N2-methylase RsmD
MFSNVYAIELDQSRFSFLKHNMFTLRNTNVVCIHGDALTKCAHIKQDVIFIDPPWGGPEYKNHASVSLYLSQQNLCDVCNTLAQYAKYIVVKVPTNFDEAAFLASTSMHMKMVYKNLSLRKMHLMIMRVQQGQAQAQVHPL